MKLEPALDRNGVWCAADDFERVPSPGFSTEAEARAYADGYNSGRSEAIAEVREMVGEMFADPPDPVDDSAADARSF